MSFFVFAEGVCGVEGLDLVRVQFVWVVVEEDVVEFAATLAATAAEYELETLEKVLEQYFDEARKVLEMKVGDGGVVVQQYVESVQGPCALGEQARLQTYVELPRIARSYKYIYIYRILIL